MDNGVKRQASDLKDRLSDNVLASYHLLLEFVDKNNRDDVQIRAKTIFLGSEIFDILEEEESYNLPKAKKEGVLQEALGIVDEVVKQHERAKQHEPTNGAAVDHASELRDYFLSKQTNEVVFRGNHIGKKYKNFELKNASFELRLGEITGIVGENGNGKSTVLKIVAGEIAPSAGECLYPFLGNKRANWVDVKQSIGYVPQTIADWQSYNTVKEQLHFTAAIKGVKGKKNEEAVDFIITRLGLRKFAEARWGELSGGYRLRFELARQLVWHPKMLVLDEPLAHLDVKAQNSLLNDLRSLADSLKNPIAIVLSSQNLYDIEKIADKVVYISGGKVVYHGAVEEISSITGCNCFIVDVDCDTLALRGALQHVSEDILEIKEEYRSKLIVTRRTVNAETLLKTLVHANVSISHFRDISNSTRILFEDAVLAKKDIP